MRPTTKKEKNWRLLMPEDASAGRDATVTGTIERVRSERFADIDRDLVLEILRFHADGTTPENTNRLVDEAIAKRTPAVA